MFEFLESRLKAPGEKPPAGFLSVLRAMPDPFTQEIINVGVVVTDARGRRYAKTISEPGRLLCLFGEDEAKMLVDLAKIAGEQFIAGKREPTETIRLSEPQPFYNMTAKEALDESFEDVVTVAIPLRSASENHTSLKTEKLRTEMYDLMKLGGEFWGVDKSLPKAKVIPIRTKTGTRNVSVPLVSDHSAAGLESADYSPPMIKSHLLDAWLDVEYLSDAFNIQRRGLFIWIPASKSYDKKQRDIENAVDYVTDRLPKNCYWKADTDKLKIRDEIFAFNDLRAA